MSNPATLRVSATNPTGDVEAKFRMSLMNQTAVDNGFNDPEFTVGDTIDAIIAGNVNIVAPAGFVGYGNPVPERGDDDDTLIVRWANANGPMAIAKRRVDALNVIGFAYNGGADDPVDALASAVLDGTLDLRVFLQAPVAAPRATATKGAGDFANAVIGTIYVSDHGETLQCVTLTDWRTADGRTWSSPSAAGRNLRAERDGGDPADSKYNTNGKKYFNFPRI